MGWHRRRPAVYGAPVSGTSGRVFFLSWVAVAAAIVPGCHRLSGPDQPFEKAQVALAQALEERGDDAWDDARADDALKAARAVPAESIDRAAADDLIARIEGARRDEATLARRLKKEATLVPDPSTRSARPRVPPASRRAPDAGTPAPQPPVVGSSEAAFQQRYGACVRPLAPFVARDGTAQGEAWALVAGACEARYPELAGRAVALLGGKVFNVVPTSTFARAPPDAGTPR